ncbi:DgyrCDS3810 [Dimorphilus gyrociliatus]|uniref:WD repeat-containing protein on Y chromosome n=1 Tax=Dimorphilus gyrociliatus TaxID=2664684 RepID=A0A7I8VF20_9ANNE|nr:DgyrCDS3810 [Dimorphilus gyrociliatus]
MIYNQLFQKIVASGADGYVYVFAFETGDRILQFSAHRTEVYGQEEGLEITTMAFDYSQRRLFTAGRDGIVRCWNFNNGMMLQELREAIGSEIMTIATSPKKKIWTAGWNRILIEYDDNPTTVETETKKLFYDRWHNEDIQTACCDLRSGRLATASYDGDIYLWNVETHQPLMKFNASKGVVISMSLYKDISTTTKENTLEGHPITEKVARARQRYIPRNRHPLSVIERIRNEQKRSKMGVSREQSPCRVKLKERRMTINRLQKATKNCHKFIKSTGATERGKLDSKVISLSQVSHSSLSSTPDKLEKNKAEKPLNDRRVHFKTSRSNSVNDDKISDMKPKSRRMSQILSETSKILQQYIENQDQAVYKLLILAKRIPSQFTATLIAAGAKGWIRFWSIRPGGGLIGQFNAAHLVGDSILSICTDTCNIFLFTSDTGGYVKVWDIGDYCVEEPLNETFKHRLNLIRAQYEVAFPLLSLPQTIWDKVLKQKKHEPPSKCSLPHRTWTAPKLLTSFRAHMQPINSIDYVNDKQIILTCSSDRSIRLFSLTGQFLGVLGKARKNPPILLNMYTNKDLPPIDKDINQLDIIRSARTKYYPPPDIAKEASPTTLHVNKMGKSRLWKRVKTAVSTSKPSDKKIRFGKTVGVSEFSSRFKKLRTRYLQRQHGMFGLCCSEVNERVYCLPPSINKSLTPLKSKILGNSYKKLRNFRSFDGVKCKIDFQQNYPCVYSNLRIHEMDNEPIVPKQLQMFNEDEKWMQKVLETDKQIRLKKKPEVKSRARSSPISDKLEIIPKQPTKINDSDNKLYERSK